MSVRMNPIDTRCAVCNCKAFKKRKDGTLVCTVCDSEYVEAE